MKVLLNTLETSEKQVLDLATETLTALPFLTLNVLKLSFSQFVVHPSLNSCSLNICNCIGYKYFFYFIPNKDYVMLCNLTTHV